MNQIDEQNLRLSDKNSVRGLKINQTINYLTIEKFLYLYKIVNNKKQKVYYAYCLCLCGKSKHILCGSIKSHRTKSCGCLKLTLVTKHGEHKSDLYNAYNGMKQRCASNKMKYYKYYGSKNIQVYEEWKLNFNAFKQWALENGWKEKSGLSIERKNNDLDYCPDNCLIIHKNNQGKNTSRSVWLTVFNETKTMIDWSRDPRCKVGYKTLKARIRANTDAEKAILTPSKREKLTNE